MNNRSKSAIIKDKKSTIFLEEHKLDVISFLRKLFEKDKISYVNATRIREYNTGDNLREVPRHVKVIVITNIEKNFNYEKLFNIHDLGIYVDELGFPIKPIFVIFTEELPKRQDSSFLARFNVIHEI